MAPHGRSDNAGPPVRSLLDTDLYKLTMQQAILESSIADPEVSYKFTNRSSKDMRFTKECVQKIDAAIQLLADLRLENDERQWLEKNCPYLKPAYLDHLARFKFCPRDEIDISFIPDKNDPELGDLDIRVHGQWSQVILYEVPLMSIVSETYFTTIDTRWDMTGQRALAKEKAKTLISNGIRFSEFGSRRRRSYLSHKYCMEGLVAGEKEALAAAGASTAAPGKLLGTSNVHFAHLFDLVPIGTVAHEWTMAVAALEGYDHVNLKALQLWDQVYSSPAFVPNSPTHDLTIALTDTFSTRVFFDDLLSTSEGKTIAQRWRGLRQDSGDPKAFALRAKQVYDSLDIDPKSKVVIYSDSLNVQRCIDLQQYSKKIGIGAGFGVGTFFTNDFRIASDPRVPSSEGDPDAAPPDDSAPVSKPLNIVIKLATVADRPVVKISDDLTKNTGDQEEVYLVKRRFGLLDENMHGKVPEDG